MRLCAAGLLLAGMLCGCTQGDEAMGRYEENATLGRVQRLPEVHFEVRHYMVEGCALTLNANGTATLGFPDGKEVGVRDESQIYEIGPAFLYQMAATRPETTKDAAVKAMVDAIWGDMVEDWRLRFALEEVVPTLVAEMKRKNAEARVLAEKLVGRRAIVAEGTSLPRTMPGAGTFLISEKQRAMLEEALGMGAATAPK